MELDTYFQIASENLQKQYFDAAIAISGYESRSSYLVEKLDTSDIPLKIVVAYNELCDSFNQNYNNQKFNELGFLFYNVASTDTSRLPDILNHIWQKKPKDTLDLLIDYSSMSKFWYYAILSYFSELEERYSHVNLWFCYSPSEYTKPLYSMADRNFDPVVPVTNSDKPVALVLGLGYETVHSLGLARKLNAQVTFACYADPAYDNRYVKEVLQNNDALLKTIDCNQIIKYPIYDLNSINSSLTQLCVNLRLTHQIVLAPVGPKPFTLMCFILATRYPDVKLWKVATAGSIAALERKPYGELLLYKVSFTSEEVDY
jgi:hypothetical protein